MLDSAFDKQQHRQHCHLQELIWKMLHLMLRLWEVLASRSFDLLKGNVFLPGTVLIAVRISLDTIWCTMFFFLLARFLSELGCGFINVLSIISLHSHSIGSPYLHLTRWKRAQHISYVYQYTIAYFEFCFIQSWRREGVCGHFCMWNLDESFNRCSVDAFDGI